MLPLTVFILGLILEARSTTPLFALPYLYLPSAASLPI